MKALFEFLVVILFFATYVATQNIVWATAVAVVGGVAQAAFLWLKYKKLQTMQWLSLVLIVVFGGATIVFQDAQFIMWKPTILFWAMALALLLAQILGKNPLKAAMGKDMALPEKIWPRLAYAWVGFLTLMGLINLWVAYRFTEAQWVNYKLFGSTGLLIAFVIAQMLWLSPYLSANKENN